MNQEALPTAEQIRKSRIKMLWLFAFFASPVIASYTAYYLIKPTGRTNYGDLVEPQVAMFEPARAIAAKSLDDVPFRLQDFKGKWVFLSIDSAQCDANCASKLYAIRQVRLTTGKDRERIERLFLVNDQLPANTQLLAEHEGMFVARAAKAQLEQHFGVQASDHIFLIDPMGNLMMRFPKNADPNRMKKDISKLLRASRIG
jgi:cytochrome oxidase Cu insertion factor (SCO1/SenC/PrrC family)